MNSVAVFFTINLLVFATFIGSTHSLSSLDMFQPFGLMMGEDTTNFFFQLANMLNSNDSDCNSTDSSGGKSSLEDDLKNVEMMLLKLIMMEAINSDK
ncbi:hypothetical protein TNCT_551361 [Trichonephila clavata]|uniref:Uncharacterized protein n=1 Tax=Trichonephila clavata TaxID=2740835 RepID=A0A8X6HZZ8_TRICU|nr:hypothetical protein TNCT_514761 [Trichonephila clavata]GFR23323.1 hypothetical protein TNCT_551361 [Trichonephila clavata]